MAGSKRKPTRQGVFAEPRGGDPIGAIPDLTDHQRYRARFRLSCLVRFWAAERAAGYRNRMRVMRRVVAEIQRENPGVPISVKSMQAWELKWNRRGPIGLVDRTGRRDLPSHGFARVSSALVESVRPQLLELKRLGLAYENAGTWHIWRPVRQRGGERFPDRVEAALAVWANLALGDQVLTAATFIQVDLARRLAAEHGAIIDAGM